MRSAAYRNKKPNDALGRPPTKMMEAAKRRVDRVVANMRATPLLF
jgi:hypothetical protein